MADQLTILPIFYGETKIYYLKLKIKLSLLTPSTQIYALRVATLLLPLPLRG
jgi:hypothetical protein